MREVLRVTMVKDWVAMPLESMYFTKYDKVLSKKAVCFYCECSNNRCVVFHYPGVKKQHLRKEIKATKLEAMSGTIENYDRHVNR